MPSVSRAQQKAMFSAASGNSTLGIPQKVGAEFAEADMKRAHGGKLTRGDRGKMEQLKGRAESSAERSHKHRHGKAGRY